MMKIGIQHLARITTVPLVLALILFSCKKDELKESILPRQFTPGTITVAAGETQALITWRPSLFAESDVPYTIEISTDTLFQGPVHYTTVTNEPRLLLTEADLDIEQKYFARVKANTVNSTTESYWAYSNSFMITGEQIFFPVLDAELKDKSVILRWRESTGLTRIVLTPSTGAATEYNLTAGNITDGFLLIEDLEPETMYTATIFQGTVRKGITSFTTKILSIYTVILSPGASLVDAVDAAADGDIIGLEPGTYDCTDNGGAYVNLVFLQKTVTIASVSGNPSDTKVNFRELTLKGTGAGVTVRGIHFDGLAAGTQSAYFLNLVGLGSDAEAADFKNIVVDNCEVSNMGNCFFRGNRGGNNAHKIDTIRVTGSIVYDSRYLSAYTFFTMEKLEFESLEIYNSTLYRLGRAFIGYSTNITVPVIPRIIIDQTTINSFGRDTRNNFFIDANGNQANITVTNSIIANTPMDGQTTGSSLMRATNATSSISYTNMFNISDGAATPGTPSFPSVVSLSNITNENLGWTGATNDFTLPAAAGVRTSSSSGGPVGDLRWAF